MQDAFSEALIDSLREAVVVLDSALRVQRVNRPFYEMFGVEPNETIGRPVYALGNGQWDIPALRRLLEEILPRQHVFDDYEVEHVFEGVGWRRMSLSARQLDHVPLILLTIRDLTEVTRSQRALEDNERRFRALVEASAHVVYRMNADWTGMRQLIGPDTPADVELRTEALVQKYVPAEDRAQVARAIQTAIRRKCPFELEHRVVHADGTPGWMFSRAVPVMDAKGEILEWVGMSGDITKRKLAETENARLLAEVRMERDRITALVASMQDEVWFSDLQHQIRLANPAALKQFGFPMDMPIDVESMGARLRIARPDGSPRPENETPLLRALRGEVVRDEEIVQMPGSGERRHRQVSATPVRDEVGRIVGAVAVVRDITEQKLAEAARETWAQSLEKKVAERTEELEAERNFMHALLDTQAALVTVTDAEGRLVRFNRAYERLSGFSVSELHGTGQWWELVPPKERAALRDRVFARLEAGADVAEHENHVRDREGGLHLVHWQNAALRDDAGQLEYVVSTGIDVTELRAAQEAANAHLEDVSRLQRLQTANELALLLAHELNQPLATIASYAEVGLQLLGKPKQEAGRLGDTLRNISRQAIRAGDIIRHLREFISRRTVAPAAMDLNGVVRSACDLLAPLAHRSAIEVTLVLDRSLPFVIGVSLHVEQVLLNLLHNAFDAIQEGDTRGGVVTVQTQRLGDWARVTVSDSGPGVDEDMAARLFQPLASHKPHGLGVGLRISRSLIEAQGGRLWLEPRVPGGVFHFELQVET